jgi:ribosomal protein S27E
LFTASGTQYFHVFNVSLCTDSYAKCYKNVSLQHGVDNQSTSVEALVCQSTIFPPAGGTVDTSESISDGSFNNGYSEMLAKPLSTHASSLGDHLIGISHTPSILGLSVTDDMQSNVAHPHQFHFFYSTPE